MFAEIALINLTALATPALQEAAWEESSEHDTNRYGARSGRPVHDATGTQ